MKRTTISLLLLSLIASPVMAQQPGVVTVMSRELADIPGKEVVMITVEFPPGGSDPVHRHNAHGFIYVLEGSVVMQVKGGKEVTLTPGQTTSASPVNGFLNAPRIASGCSSETTPWPARRA